MLSNDVHQQDSAELVARQAVIVAVAAHMRRWPGPRVRLSAHLDTAGTQAWRRAAGPPLGT